MKAFRMVGWHQDAQLVDIDDPAPGPGQVLVKIGGAGVCHSDLHLLYEFDAGMMPWAPPFTLGHENAGWVAATGSGVTHLTEGTPVAVYGPWGCGRCHACAAGAENYCTVNPFGCPVGGLGADGGMAELMLVPSDRFLVPLPPALEPALAAPLTDAALTPYHAIAQARSRLFPGATAVVIGVGGLGHLALQILRATTDVQIIAVDPRAEALTLAKDCGADVCLAGTADVVAEVRELTGGVGAHAVFDMVASDATLRQAAASVAAAGWIGIVGLGGGTLPVSVLSVPMGVTVRPTYWGTRTELSEVLELAARGGLRPETTSFPLSRAADAYRAVCEGSQIGRAVIVPD